MDDKLPFDQQAAHRHFVMNCFNKAWEPIEKLNHSEEDDRQMVRLTHASHWHWAQISDHTPTNISIAYWQAARIYALRGETKNARRSAEPCHQVSQNEGVEPFFQGYSYEAMARAASIAGDREATETNCAEAARIAKSVGDKDSRKQLQEDLKTIA